MKTGEEKWDQVKKCEIKTKCPDLKGECGESHKFFSLVFSKSFWSMSSEFTFGDNSDKSSIFVNFDEFGWPWPHRAWDHSHTDTVTTGRTAGADKGNPTVHSHATSWLEQTRRIRLFNQTSYPSFVVFCPMQFDPCESVKWRHGTDPWRIQRGWEALHRRCFSW